MISHIGTTHLIPPEPPHPEHYHQCYEVSYVHEGHGYMQTPDGPIHFSEKAIFIIPPSLTHRLVSENGHVATSILIRNEMLTPIKRITAVSDNDKGEAETLINVMMGRDNTLDEYLQYLGKAFVLLLLELVGINGLTLDHAKAVDDIVNGINKHFSDPEFKIKPLLTTSPYAEDYIRSIFKEQTGMTPGQMLTETRLNNARNIILYSKTDRPISNIALDSGFDDFAYFSKAFKKRFGMSPTEYKAQYGKPGAKGTAQKE